MQETHTHTAPHYVSTHSLAALPVFPFLIRAGDYNPSKNSHSLIPVRGASEPLNIINLNIYIIINIFHLIIILYIYTQL